MRIPAHCHFRWMPRAISMLALLALPAVAAAQPFGHFTHFEGDGTTGSSNGYLSIPNTAALNPTSAITIEAWISVTLPFANQDCRSIVGKNYGQSYWVGVCGSGSTVQLRSYINGVGSVFTSGIVLNGAWVHVAVTSDGATRSHYVDGELVGTQPETGPPGTSTAALEIGSDVIWPYSIFGNINEVRLWNIARTEAEIRSTINVPVRTAQPGLVAVWPMASGEDAVGSVNGTFVGNLPPYLMPPPESSCGTSTGQQLCLQGHYLVEASFRLGAQGTPSADATIVSAPNSGSGIFWFVNPDDWEIMAKVLDGCSINSQWWVFSAATTNVFYQLYVIDVQTGQQKIYFNYQGPPAPAVTDTSAFGCAI
jgi:hypothetical protein